MSSAEHDTSRSRVSSGTTNGWDTVSLENDRIRVVVLPGKGAEILSIEDLSSGSPVNVLWKAPWALRPQGLSSATSSGSQGVWMDHYVGGWQVLFPNAGDPCTYMGAELSFHGEASLAPWDCSIVETTNGPGADLSADLMRSPFRISRHMSVDAVAPVLRFTETITNTGNERMPYMWGHHPAYGAPFLCEGARLTIPAKTYLGDVANAPGRTRIAPNARGTWPHAIASDGGTVDVSIIPGPGAGYANMGYALDLSNGWYALESPATGIGVAVTWPLEVMPSVWVWQEFNGGQGYPWYGRSYVMGVEPHSSWPGHGLLGAIKAGTARWLEPGASETVDFTFTLFHLPAHGLGHVTNVTPTGSVEFE